ncbi:MAG: thermitase, partial [Gaiellaceae bacterium]|nr:thermitase [Gaiellaceae bacterium]
MHRFFTVLGAAPAAARALATGRRRLVLGCLVAASLVLSLAFAASARAGYYYCSAGLLDTGTTDDMANGSNCSYWLLSSFPSGGTADPQENGTSVPGLDVLPVWQRTEGAGVTVALIDTGVDPNQTDYAPNLLPGWNFYDGNADTSDGYAH